MGGRIDFEACRDCYCLAARRRARAVTRIYDEHLRPYGVRSTQFSVLAALAIKGPTRVTQLAGILGLERTTLTRIGALLARDGLVTVAASGDGRERRLMLSRAGRRTLERAYPAWKAAQERVGAQIANRSWPGDVPAGPGSRLAGGSAEALHPAAAPRTRRRTRSHPRTSQFRSRHAAQDQLS